MLRAIVLCNIHSSIMRALLALSSWHRTMSRVLPITSCVIDLRNVLRPDLMLVDIHSIGGDKCLMFKFES